MVGQISSVMTERKKGGWWRRVKSTTIAGG